MARNMYTIHSVTFNVYQYCRDIDLYPYAHMHTHTSLKSWWQRSQFQFLPGGIPILMSTSTVGILICTHTHTCMHTCIRTHAYLYTHTCMLACAHKHTHTHTIIVHLYASCPKCLLPLYILWLCRVSHWHARSAADVLVLSKNDLLSQQNNNILLCTQWSALHLLFS